MHNASFVPQVAATLGVNGRLLADETVSTSGQTRPLWSCPTAATAGSGEHIELFTDCLVLPC